MQQVSIEKDEKHCPIHYAIKEPKQNVYRQPGPSKDNLGLLTTQNNLQNNPDRHVLLSMSKKDLQRLTALCTILSMNTIILFSFFLSFLLNFRSNCRQITSNKLVEALYLDLKDLKQSKSDRVGGGGGEKKKGESYSLR